MDLEKICNITEEKLPEIKTFFIGTLLLIGFIVSIDSFLNQFANLNIKSAIYLLSLFYG